MKEGRWERKEAWKPTMELRFIAWKRSDGVVERRLQQKHVRKVWTKDTLLGFSYKYTDEEWKDVPTDAVL